MAKPSNILIVIAGPTAVGKTVTALTLALKYQCDILSADSRQLYKELSIGTAKASAAELDLVKHHFINHLSIHESFSVGKFEKEAIALLDQLFEQNPIQILCGGSGLFINAVCKGLDEFPDIDPEINKELDSIFEKDGIEALQKLLKEKDPKYYDSVDLQNSRRLIRALSVIEQTGKTFTSFWTKKKKARNFTVIPILLEDDRERLYARINKRVDAMLTNGLEEEARSVQAFKENKALQTVGYQEWFDFFDEKISKEEAIRLIKRNSRRYAKRQGTWFRRDQEWNRFPYHDSKSISAFLEQRIKEIQSA